MAKLNLRFLYTSTGIINVLGLAFGLACSLLIYLWVYDELHVDRFYSNSDRLYSVMVNQRQKDQVVTGNNGSIILGKALRNAFPEVEYAATTTPAGWFKSFSVLYPGRDVVQGLGNFASADFFRVFPRSFVAGDAGSALTQSHSVAISKGLALRLFHTTDGVVGKMVQWKWNQTTKSAAISGIYEDFPANSTIHYDLVLQIGAFEEIISANEDKADISGGPFQTFVVLKKGANAEVFNHKITNFITAVFPQSGASLFIAKYADNYLKEGGRIVYVRMLGLIAICVLVIAGINFVNLATAKASERMKEIGVKKTLGASRGALMRQFLGESVLLSFVSLLVAILFVVVLYPTFKSVTGKQFLLLSDPWLILSVPFFTLLVGLFAGIYPALYLSRFKPIAMLKGKFSVGGSGLFVRKALVVFQFAVSVIFIAIVVVVYMQVKYVRSANPGFDKDNVIYFEMKGKVASAPESFLSTLRGIPGVLRASSMVNTIVSSSGTPPGGVYWDGENADDKIRFEQSSVNYDAIETLGIQMASGRSFSRQYSDSAAVILNESAVRVMGLQHPLGKVIRVWGQPKTIVGVTKDFHFNSFHTAIRPFLFKLEPQSTFLIMIRIGGRGQRQTIEAIAKAYKEFDPGIFFDYRFLDADYQQQYVLEELVATLSKFFAGLAILISCLGLFGLTAFAVEKRVKEIGIRRTLGASRTGIVFLLSKDFAFVVGLSVLIGSAVSYMAAHAWLNGFAYRIGLSPWYFVFSAGITMLIAFVTIGVQSIRASMVKPVASMKSL